MSEESNKRVFTIDDIEYAVRRPTLQELTKANEQRAKTFNQSLQRGDLLRDQLDGELRKRELWNDDREAEYQGLRQSVIDGEFALSKGGISLSEARDIALAMSDSRQRMISMLSTRSELDQNTCEGKADAIRFNYLFSVCLVYNDTDEAYFKEGLGEYLLNQEDPVALKGATEFYYLISGSEDVDKSLPENKFLSQYSLVDENYRLIDKDGRLISKDGKHIDENGNLIRWINDEEYEIIDQKGRKVDEQSGKFDVEFSPFLDDDGKPIVLEDKSDGDGEETEEPEPEEEVAEKPKPKRRGRPKKNQPEKKEEAESAS